MSLHVLMDGRALMGRFSGVARFITSLTNELARRDDVRVTLLCGADSVPQAMIPREVAVFTSDFRKRDRTPVRRMIWEQLRLPGVVHRLKPDVYHATWNTGVPPASLVPSVLTIHDLIPWYNRSTNLREALSRLAYRCAIRTSVRRAREIATVSDYVGFHVRTILGKSQPIQTIHNGVDGQRAVDSEQQEVSCKRPFALYVGGHEERKNVTGLFAAMQVYWANYSEPLDLWLTGEAKSLSPSASFAFQRLPNRNCVRFLGQPGDEELDAIYKSASVLLMLSHDEGFGLPAAEAMAHGCPVIASNKGSLPEIVGNGGILVNPNRPQDVASALHAALTDSNRREFLIANGLRRARMFCWKKTASAYVHIYQELTACRRPRISNWTQSATIPGLDETSILRHNMNRACAER